MKLQEFVNESLREIIAGVKEAQEYAKDNNATVNASPPTLRPPIKEVEFDVAVTSIEGSQAQAGAGIFVAGLGLGAKGKMDTSNSSATRIRFSVPVCLPHQR
ncbi:MAG: hypothetical protein KBE65_18255 [Phycisphaerae bacterium]|nr:hypothetical protein [Phycisphaerae bacterium]